MAKNLMIGDNVYYDTDYVFFKTSTGEQVKFVDDDIVDRSKLPTTSIATFAGNKVNMVRNVSITLPVPVVTI